MVCNSCFPFGQLNVKKIVFIENVLIRRYIRAVIKEQFSAREK